MQTPRRFGALIISACLFSTLLLMFSSGEVAAVTTRTWDAAGNSSASIPASWDPVGVPVAGDTIIFDGTSVTLCNWNLEIVLDDFSMLAGYTGTVTTSVIFASVDFIIASGTFVAGNFTQTASGNWDTDGYTHDENVVYLTGVAKALDMAATDSFYNLTVSAGASYTLADDVNIDLRATVLGTVDGAGSFIEPLPEFTSTPWPNACPLRLYESPITQTYWDDLAINDAPYWMVLVDEVLTGIPGENDTGVFSVSLILTWNDMVTYQNFTLVVCSEGISEYQFASFELAIALCFCFGIMLAGFKERMLLILAGLVWMVCGIAIFIDYGDAFLYVSVGLGASLLFKGAYDVWK